MTGVTDYGLAASRREMMSLGANADCDDNGKNNHRFHDVDPQCALRKSQNNVRFHHDLTPSNNQTTQIHIVRYGYYYLLLQWKTAVGILIRDLTVHG